MMGVGEDEGDIGPKNMRKRNAAVDEENTYLRSRRILGQHY